MYYRFNNRSQAGEVLAEKLTAYQGRSDVVVLALPRGGVPVAWEVAEKLQAPLDVFLVRKLGVPGHEEFAMGAIASGGVCFVNEGTVEALHLSRAVVDRVIEREQEELRREEQLYRRNEPMVEIEGRVVILVDDGLATGASMRAAVMAVRLHRPARIVVAVPVAAYEVYRSFTGEVDEVVCGETPDPFFAVGEWYEDFRQISDEEVQGMLEKAARVPA